MSATDTAAQQVDQLRGQYRDRLAAFEAAPSKTTEDATLTAGHDFMAAIRANRHAIVADPAAFRAASR